MHTGKHTLKLKFYLGPHDMHMEQLITHENMDKRESPRMNNSLISHRESKTCY
ncbi:hypothetical protein F511_21682 [Dorcoceras hygrometricum]|uniref:Uncharacterized protein n=1 Tax=Dorcoceras hygrometricum TaxID=472368 RepID=A0A2Z7CP83_9LAMI|nr:hypothetical protein F511_21682 [Dorcoceras hygrometricum]